MILLKSCPRCHVGDLIEEYDVFGLYLLCLQCGFTKETVPQSLEADLRALAEKKASVSRPA